MQYQLDWDQGPIRILGVNFTPEVFDMWELIYNTSTEKCKKKILNSWLQKKFIFIRQNSNN